MREIKNVSIEREVRQDEMGISNDGEEKKVSMATQKRRENKEKINNKQVINSKLEYID
jgi:hypothetical protein